MVEILRLVLTNFWPFIAAWILICAIGTSIATIVTAFKTKRTTE